MRHAFSVRVVLAGVATVQLACGSSSPVAPTAGANAPVLGTASAAGTVGSQNVRPNLVLRTNPAMNGDTISGQIPLTVMFNLCPSDDPDPGDSLNWQFNFGDSGRTAFNPDGTFNPDFDHFCRVEHTYERAGTYPATVSVTDKHLEDQTRGVVSLARTWKQIIIQATGKPEPAAPAACSPPGIGVSTNFDSFGCGTSPGLSGVTFTAGSYLTCSPPFTTMTGNQLFDNYSPLTITWTTDQSAASFKFWAWISITVEGYSNTGALLFSTVFTPVMQSSGYSEGSASVSGAFRSLVIYGNGGLPQASIDDLQSTPVCQ